MVEIAVRIVVEIVFWKFIEIIDRIVVAIVVGIVVGTIIEIVVERVVWIIVAIVVGINFGMVTEGIILESGKSDGLI